MNETTSTATAAWNDYLNNRGQTDLQTTTSKESNMPTKLQEATNTVDAEAYCDECGMLWDKGDITKNFAGSGRSWCFECIDILENYINSTRVALIAGRPVIDDTEPTAPPTHKERAT